MNRIMWNSEMPERACTEFTVGCPALLWKYNWSKDAEKPMCRVRKVLQESFEVLTTLRS